MNVSHTPLLAGAVIGLSVAMPVGPMGLLCIQRTLSSGMRVGWLTGLGAATVNVLYGSLVIFGLAQAEPFMAQGDRLLSVLGGILLLWSAARTFRRGLRASSRSHESATSPATAYGSALLFSLGNPLGPLLMIALLSPVVSRQTLTAAEGLLLLLGLFLAAASWWLCLSGIISLLRARLSPGVLIVVNRFAGILLTIYGTLSLMRAAGP